MKNDVARHVKNCRACPCRKSPKNMKRAPLHPIEVTQPLEVVGVDFVGPLPTTEKGNKYIMTMHMHHQKPRQRPLLQGFRVLQDILDFLVPSCQIEDPPLCQS